MRTTPGREAGRARCLCWGARWSQVALPRGGQGPRAETPLRCWWPAPGALWPLLSPSPHLRLWSQPSQEACGPPTPASVLTGHSRRVALPTLGLCVLVPRAGVLGEGGAL